MDVGVAALVVGYIGTREGVELLPAGYMEYMAERPRSHGLFGDEDNVDMDAAMKELNEYPGNIWTHIISLKREDAERLGYFLYQSFHFLSGPAHQLISGGRLLLVGMEQLLFENIVG